MKLNNKVPELYCNVSRVLCSANAKSSGLSSPRTIPTALQNLEVEWPLLRFRVLCERYDAVPYIRTSSISKALASFHVDSVGEIS
jgi:hypothetical protein